MQHCTPRLCLIIKNPPITPSHINQAMDRAIIFPQDLAFFQGESLISSKQWSKQLTHHYTRGNTPFNLVISSVNNLSPSSFPKSPPTFGKKRPIPLNYFSQTELPPLEGYFSISLSTFSFCPLPIPKGITSDLFRYFNHLCQKNHKMGQIVNW